MRSRDAIVRNFQPTSADTVMGDPPPRTGSWATWYAQRIVNDPQAHIDALVEAGVLKIDGFNSATIPEGLQYPIYKVVQPRKPCPAWVEVGYGRQTCVEEAGHDEGDVPRPHRSRRAGDAALGLTAMDTLWVTGQ